MRTAVPLLIRLALVVGGAAVPLGCATPPATEPSTRAAEATVRTVPPALRWADLEPRPGAGGESLEELVSGARGELSRTVMPDRRDDPERERAALGLYLEGRTARQDGRADEALRLLRRADELDPGRVAILRELGRAQQLAGRSTDAVATFGRLLEIEPYEPNAVYALMLEAGRREDHEEVIRLGLGMRAADRRFRQDPAAPIVADELLRRALLATGRERAALEVGTVVLEATAAYGEATNLGGQLTVVLRSRADIALACADVALRLDRPAEAFALLDAAEGAALLDPAALLERRLVALRRLGRDAEARSLFVESVASAPDAVGGATIAAARWLAEPGAEDALRDALRRRAGAIPRPDGLLRLQAALAPPAEAERLLATRVAERSGAEALPLLADLLARAAPRSPRAAIDHAARAAVREPYLVGQIATMLQRTLPPGTAFPSDPAAESLRIRFLVRLDEPGLAWHEIEAARRRWPNDEGLVRLAVDLAGVLDEAPLLDAALASVPAHAEPATRIVAIGAKIAAGRFEEAAADAVAERARTPAPTPTERGWCFALQARALSELAETMPVGPARDDRFRQVAALAREALDCDPHQHQAWLLLVALHGAAGPLADATALRSVVRRVPDDPTGRGLLAQLRATEFAGQGQQAAAVAAAARQVLDDPDDEASLGILAGGLAETGRADEARAALLDRVRRAPGDLAALQQLVRLALRTDAAEEILPQVEALRDAGVPAEAIDRQREILLGVLGRVAEGTALAEARMARRPPGSRRLLQEAGIALRAGDAAKAMDRLEAMLDPTLAAARRHLLTALGLCGQLPAGDERADAMRIALVESAAARFEAIPLSAYNAALVASAHQGLSDSPRFERLLQAALASGPPTGPSLREIAPWREVAQNLAAADPRAASRLLTALLEAPAPLDRDALVVLSSMAIVAAMPAADGADVIVRIVGRLRAQGLLNAVPALGEVASEPEAWFAISQTANVLRCLGTAEGLLERTLAAAPDLAMARNNLGYDRIDRGLGDAESIALVEGAAAALPDDPSVRDSLAWLRYKQGRFDEAIEILRELAARPDDEVSGDVLDHLGDAAWRLGASAEAESAWRRAIERWRTEGGGGAFLESVRDYQVRAWGLLVVDPRTIYDRAFTEPIRHAEAKLAALAEGVPPPVAPTFSERTAAE